MSNPYPEVQGGYQRSSNNNNNLPAYPYVEDNRMPAQGYQPKPQPQPQQYVSSMPYRIKAVTASSRTKEVMDSSRTMDVR